MNHFSASIHNRVLNQEKYNECPPSHCFSVTSFALSSLEVRKPSHCSLPLLSPIIIPFLILAFLLLRTLLPRPPLPPPSPQHAFHLNTSLTSHCAESWVSVETCSVVKHGYVSSRCLSLLCCSSQSFLGQEVWLLPVSQLVRPCATSYSASVKTSNSNSLF